MEFFIQLLITGVVLGSIYALVALGFVLIYKSTGVINFAQGEFLMLGAYICLQMVVGYHMNFWASFVLTLIVCGIIGLLIERLFLRPMIGEPIISIIMLTIGLSSVLRAVMQLFWGTQTKVFPQIFSEKPLHITEHIGISEVYIYSIIFAAIFLTIFTLFFKFNRSGIAMRATADDQQAAMSMGISIKKIFALAWCIAAIVSAVGGILIGNINGINVSLSFYGLKVFPVVILGGLDSIGGAIVGGLIIGVLENLCGGYLDPIMPGIKEVAPFIVLVVILMIKPYGLFGTEEIEKV
jgi:branched-chain amino acid transport system permease protein